MHRVHTYKLNGLIVRVSDRPVTMNYRAGLPVLGSVTTPDGRPVARRFFAEHVDAYRWGAELSRSIYRPAA